MDEDKNKDENEKEELIGDKELKVETTTTSQEEKADVVASPMARAVESNNSNDSPDTRDVTSHLSSDMIPLTDTIGALDTTIGLKSITSTGSIGLLDSKDDEEEEEEEEDKKDMKVSHYDRKKKNSTSDVEWKWIQDVQCLKIENRLQLIQSVSTHVPEREYLVYIWDDKDQSKRVRRDLDKLVLHVKERSSYWQRQIFGSWRGFELSFYPSRWDMKKMKIIKDPSILTCMAPSNTDMYPREYEIRNIPSSVRRNRLGNVTAVRRTAREKERTLINITLEHTGTTPIRSSNTRTSRRSLRI